MGLLPRGAHVTFGIFASIRALLVALLVVLPSCARGRLCFSFGQPSAFSWPASRGLASSSHRGGHTDAHSLVGRASKRSVLLASSDAESRGLQGLEDDGSRTCVFYNVPGLVPYLDGLAWQRALQKERIDHKIAYAGKLPFFLPDALVLLEHPVVYTLGSSSEYSDILFPVESAELQQVGDSIEVTQRDSNETFSIHRVQRGGKVTYHCPGQIVGYPIVDLARHRQDIEWYLRTIENVIISVLADYGVDAGIEPGLTGVWVGGKKIAAIGVGASRWVTLHGWALNVKAQMKGFDRIVPCGIQDREVVSLDEILGDQCPPVAEVRLNLARTFAKQFDLDLYDTGGLSPADY